MFHVILPILLALVGGAGGFLLRRRELATIFDSNGLPTLWSTPTLLLIALSVAVAVVLILLVRKRAHMPTDYTEGFSAQNNWLYLMVMAFAACALLMAGILGLRSRVMFGSGQILSSLTDLLCLLSFFCVLSAALDNFRGSTPRFNLLLLAPGYTFCFWLVCSYQKQAADPVVLDFVYQLLAIICSLIGMYFSAGYSFGRPKFRRCVVFSLLGIFFTLVTLAEPHSLTDRLMFLFALLYQLANVTVLLYRTYRFIPPTKSVEKNTTQEVTPDE